MASPGLDSKMKPEYIRRSIKFKTSRTYPQTLFPSLAFSFTAPGTVADATFRVGTVDKLTGLAEVRSWACQNWFVTLRFQQEQQHPCEVQLAWCYIRNSGMGRLERRLA